MQPYGIGPARPLRPAEPVQAIAREVSSRFASIPLGQPIWGAVKAQFADGMFLVEVEDAEIRMRLPSAHNPGDRLQLALLARSPQLTFLLRTVPKVDRTCLSSAGEAIAKLLGRAHDSAAPSSVVGTDPIVQDSAANPAQISEGLRERLATSGLFYESHVAEWVGGSRSLESLSREPQQRLTANPRTRSKGAVDTDAPPQDLASLVELQLDALEQQRMAWRGELWPGQFMQWEVGKRTEQATSQGSHEERTDPIRVWETAIQLELPALGNITARLQVTGSRLQIRIHTSDSWSTSKLTDRTRELVCSLSDSGLLTESLSISHHVES
jgi:hypothetical protein